VDARALRGLLAGLPLLVAAGCTLSRDRPDVVLISVDTLRTDHLGAYGDAAARTPVFDRLARQGRLFRQATTPFPRTTPALGSLLTGLWPRHHGSLEVGQPMRKAVPTLAMTLRAHGWATLGVSANLLAGRRQRLDRGFERFTDARHLRNQDAAHVTRRALALVRKISRRRPVMLWAHYVDPHYTYAPPAAPRAESECDRLQRAVSAKELPRGIVDSNWDGRSERALASCLALYDGEIAYVDREVGKLLEGLRRAGRLERALVIFTSDHGENFGEAGLFYEHGPSVNDASLRVPLLFMGEGVVPGEDQGVARLEDVPPTVLEWLGLDPPEGDVLDGVSLADRLRGAPPSGAADAVAFAESGRAFHLRDFRRPLSGPGPDRCANGERLSFCRFGDGREGLFDPRADPALEHDIGAAHPADRRRLRDDLERWQARDLRLQAARTPRFKLVVRPQLDGTPRRQLYDLASDPRETRDVADLHPDERDRLTEALARWAEGGSSRAPELGEKQLELLRRMGYVE
jgi:arylsulfatase A-like enzyme